MRPLFGVNGKVRLKKEEKARIRSKKKEKRLDRVGIVRDVRFRTSWDYRSSRAVYHRSFSFAGRRVNKVRQEVCGLSEPSVSVMPDPWKAQLQEARAEWRRRHPKG
jgi:hypothetical protein